MLKAKNKFLFALIAILFLPSLISAQIFTIASDTSQWIRSWLLCGPFPLQPVAANASDANHLPGFETDFLKAHGGEANPIIHAGQIERFAGSSVKWFKHQADSFYVDLDAAVSKEEFVVAYGYCEIKSPSDKVPVLSLGTNDGGRLWLNGQQIWDRPGGRRLIADDDLIPVVLTKGQNKLVLKIEERGNKWGFCVRFLPFDARSFSAENRFFRIVNFADGSAVLRASQTPEIVSQIFVAVKLEISVVEKPGRIVWHGEWNKQAEMQLPVDTGSFGQFNLQIQAVLADSTACTTTMPFAAGKRTEYALFENGKTSYTIFVVEDASAAEQWAAQELQYWLGEVSGAHFPIRSDGAEPRGPKIIIGFNQWTARLLPSESEPADEDESFTYKNAGADILIWGGRQRGTLYGVMSFLEHELGCRWYTPKVSVAPRKDAFRFDYLYRTEAPGIRVRNDFYYEAFDPIWAARNKINGAMAYRQQPGGVEGYWGVHTFYRFMPPEEFFAAHPEYYSLIDGKRVSDRAQLCLTNPDVLSIVTGRLLQTMRENPEYLIYSVSQNDWGNPCQCENCQAIARREGSEAGPLIWFVNRVAERVEKEFPEKFVGTLAYTYTRKPCKTLRPRENVVIRLCSIECCFAHDFLSCPENSSFVADLQDWAAIAPHLYIWDYVVNFSHYIMPYPNFRVLQPNIKTLQKHHAIGIMEQAAYQSRGGEFAELRAYVIAKLLWHPDAKIEPVINDFMLGYYGRSGQYIRQYFDLLHNQLTADTHIHLGLAPDDRIFSDEFVRNAEKLFRQAMAVAENQEISERVDMAWLPVLYLKCKRDPITARYDGTYKRFCEIVKREGITHYAESGEGHRAAFHQTVEAAK